MRFKIISAGWNCAPFAERTLNSVVAQSVDNWDLGIVVDPSTDGTEDVVRDWWRSHDGRLTGGLFFPEAQQRAVRNQHETIEALDPDPEDVIVFLDLDGDQLAHEDVLAHLQRYYSDGTLVTYGNYEPVPANSGCCPPEPFPRRVVRDRAYRHHVLTAYCSFNHLRTMKAKVFRAIPRSYFCWGRGPQKGQWYPAGTDYAFMAAALELADGRYKCIEEVLCLYNSANPHADNLEHGLESTRCHQDILRQRPLAPLLDVEVVTAQDVTFDLPPEITLPTLHDVRADGCVVAPEKEAPVDLFMTAEERREVLREYGVTQGLRVLVETGTNDGGTPWELRADFDAIYTIELGKQQFRAAAQRFKSLPHITCLQGDSTEVLPRVLGVLEAPALFWLDGHYSGPGTAHGARSTPIREELGLILADAVLQERGHVILVDDARIFEGGPEHDMYDHYAEYPSLEWVEQVATTSGYSYLLQDDIIRLLPDG